MNLGLLLAIAKVPELPSTHSAPAGAFSETGIGRPFFGPVQGPAISSGWMRYPPLELQAKLESFFLAYRMQRSGRAGFFLLAM
jgi:hypothetical protein